MPIFKDEYCNKFVEEMRHFEESDMPKGRPNTMNNHGVSMYGVHMCHHIYHQHIYVCNLVQLLLLQSISLLNKLLFLILILF